MRLRTALVVIAVLAFIVGCVAATESAAAPQQSDKPITCDGKSVALHIKRSHALLQRAYEDDFNLPQTKFIQKAQEHKLCVRIANVRSQIGEYRADEKSSWFARLKPYSCVGSQWALPCAITGCESGYNYSAGAGGAYGLLQGWDEWKYGLNDPAAQASDGKPINQDIAAHRGYVLYNGNWECPV